ncbi:hypothetical protein TUBRATIS_13340 [Tubulinosema ratisbonensis]|uniref:Uncharacterized protein n=1 Tax=Tubulinosema ratisbonensis TaxID=291195 RepID=A0A437ALV9_9MICR|nr:hypothetical protein TUBRATIS_13340 [Tubulinosema ratisbonensis]
MLKKIVKENDLFKNLITCQSAKLSKNMLFLKKRKKYFTQLVKYFKLTRKDCKGLSSNEINQIKYGFYIYKNNKDASLQVYQNTPTSFHFTYNFDSFKTVIRDLRFDSEVLFEIQPLSERMKLINFKDEDLEIYKELIISDVY